MVQPVMAGESLAPVMEILNSEHLRRRLPATSAGSYLNPDWRNEARETTIGGRGQRVKKRSSRLDGFVTKS